MAKFNFALMVVFSGIARRSSGYARADVGLVQLFNVYGKMRWWKETPDEGVELYQ